MKKLTFYIGTERNANGANIAYRRRLEMEAAGDKFLADMFGGFTKTRCEGAWTDPNDDLVREQSLRYEIVADDSYNVSAICYGLADIFEQNEVLVTVEDVRVVTNKTEDKEIAA